MIITVKKPDYCPLRHPTGSSYNCSATGSHCDNKEGFPIHCSLRSRTVIIQKEQTEKVPNYKEKPVTADPVRKPKGNFSNGADIEK